MNPKDTRNAAQRRENAHTAPAPITSQITRKGPRVILADSRAVTIEDRNRDGGHKRYRLAIPRYTTALERFGPDAVVYEYRLNFPKHLDVLDHEDAAQMWATVEALAPDAFVKLEDSRSASPFPTKPHAHFISAHLLPNLPGLWRFPDPLDLEDMQSSTPERRTLFGFFCYTAKPVLGGAARPTREEYGRFGGHFDREELDRHEMAAQDRTNAARRRAQKRGLKTLPVCLGWATGGRKRASNRAA